MLKNCFLGKPNMWQLCNAMADKNPKGKVRIHDQSVNSYGIVVLTAGIDLSRYEKNPVLIYNHNYEKLVGRLEELEVIGTEIWARPVFNSKNEFAAEKEQEFNDGFLKGFSIGIDEPYEFANGATMGLGDVLVITKCQLYETTVCTIPSNKNAVKLYGEKGIELSAERITEIKLSLSNQNTTEMKDRAKLIAKLKLSADATDEQILTAIDEQDAALAAAEQKAKDEEQKAKEAKEKAEKAQQDALDEKINLMVEAGHKAGKYAKEQIPTMVKLAKADFDSTKLMIDNIKPGVKPIELTAGGKGKPEGKAAAGREEWTYDDWATKDSKGLQLMKSNDPDKFNELLEAKKASVKR